MHAIVATVGAVMLALTPTAAGAQNSTSDDLPNSESSDDIIVSALKIPRDKLPVQVIWQPGTHMATSMAYNSTATYLRCAIKYVDHDMLRKVIDGPPNYSSTRFALGMILTENLGCYMPRPFDMRTKIVSSDPAVAGDDLLSRSQMIEQVLATYAPKSELTIAQTYNPAISYRFKEAEQIHNRFRLDNDLEAYRTVACMVQKQPGLATRLVHTDASSELARGLVQTLLIEGRQCLGGVKRVGVDPIFLRAYVVEAYYRWMIAARNVPTLIPES
jgi:hypothetical protein